MSTACSNSEIISNRATLRTPLYPLHCELGARMAPFVGYEMPIHYPLGVLKEHLHTRTDAGLFDVSHMGQIALHSKSGNAQDAARALENLVPCRLCHFDFLCWECAVLSQNSSKSTNMMACNKYLVNS